MAGLPMLVFATAGAALQPSVRRRAPTGGNGGGGVGNSPMQLRRTMDGRVFLNHLAHRFDHCYSVPNTSRFRQL